MVLTWTLLAYLIASTGDLVRMYADKGGVEAAKGQSRSWAYAVTQPGVILHYLSLTLWPNPLVLDYDWKVPGGAGDILPAALAIGLLAGATQWGVLKRKPWAFLGAWFFMILSPTSSIVPLQDPVFEHRMYLPLAGVIALLVLAAHAGAKESASRGRLAPASARLLGIGVLAAVAVALGVTTFLRNKDYATELSIWQATFIHAPENPRVLLNLGHALAQHGEPVEAARHYRTALALKPGYYQANYNLALVLAAIGQHDEAISRYRGELRLKPDSAEAHFKIGISLAATEKIDEAIHHYREAARIQPDFPEVHFHLGNLWASTGRSAEAIEQYEAALRLKPSYAQAHNNLGVLLIGRSEFERAMERFEQALRIDPGYADAKNNLARLKALPKRAP